MPYAPSPLAKSTGLADAVAPPAIPTTPTDDPEQTFARVLEKSSQTAGDPRLREAAEQLVSQALVQPMLARAREDPLRTGLFDGGRGEKAFGPMLDQELADRTVAGSGFSIVDALVRSLERRTAAATEQPTYG